MLKRFDWHCPACELTFDAYTRDGTMTCINCGHRADKRPSAPEIMLSGIDPGLPRAWRRWADWKTDPKGAKEPSRHI